VTPATLAHPMPYTVAGGVHFIRPLRSPAAPRGRPPIGRGALRRPSVESFGAAVRGCLVLSTGGREPDERQLFEPRDFQGGWGGGRAGGARCPTGCPGPVQRVAAALRAAPPAGESVAARGRQPGVGRRDRGSGRLGPARGGRDDGRDRIHAGPRAAAG